jgi:L-ascorbate metabolism protein UlaG (beta-lactamase superfamily)
MKRHKINIRIIVSTFMMIAVFVCAEATMWAITEYDAALGEVQAWLDTKPAVRIGDAARSNMLKKLDPVLQDENAGRTASVGKYFRARMSVLAADLETAKPATGSIYIWKLYNHGAIIRSSEETIAIDLITGVDKMRWNPEDLKRVVQACDALIITHGHIDHADMAVAKKFITAGKKVVTPPGIWENMPNMGVVILLRDGSIDIGGFKLTAFPSFQSTDKNNVYLMEFPNGVSVMHTGDENGASISDGGGWLAAIKKPHPVDVMIQNSWSSALQMLVDAFPPKLIIPSHEHELSHAASSRSTYEELIANTSKLGVPFALMAWGERIEIAHNSK